MVVAGMPRTAGRILRQGVQLSKRLFSRRVFAFGDTQSAYIHWQRPCRIGSNSYTLACYRETHRVGAAMLRIRWAIAPALSVRLANADTESGCVPFSSDQYLAVLCSLRLRIYHMMLSYCNRRR